MKGVLGTEDLVPSTLPDTEKRGKHVMINGAQPLVQATEGAWMTLTTNPPPTIAASEAYQRPRWAPPDASKGPSRLWAPASPAKQTLRQTPSSRQWPLISPLQRCSVPYQKPGSLGGLTTSTPDFYAAPPRAYHVVATLKDQTTSSLRPSIVFFIVQVLEIRASLSFHSHSPQPNSPNHPFALN